MLQGRIGNLRHDLTPEASARLLDDLSAVAARAAAAVLAIDRGALDAHRKPDGSAVTAADLAAQAVILPALAELLPGMPVVSEEAEQRAPPSGPTYLLVDPLDGTRELLEGRAEFTVNIALIQAGSPVMGVIAAPALGLLWRGIVGRGAERLPLADRRAGTPCAIRTRPQHAVTVAAISRSHLDSATEAFLALQPNCERIVCGSSLKFCRIAEGAADLYPRLAPTREWDVAAGHAVLTAAGGVVTTPAGAPLTYGHEEFRIPAFIAWGDAAATVCRKAALQS